MGSSKAQGKGKGKSPSQTKTMPTKASRQDKKKGKKSAAINAAKSPLKQKKTENEEDDEEEEEMNYVMTADDHIAAGKALLEFGSNEGAIDSFESALSEKPDDLDLLILLATTYKKEKQFSQAIEKYQHIVKLDPTNSTLLFNLATLYEDNEQYTEAIQVFQQVLDFKNEENMSMVYAALANCYGAMEDLEGAQNVFIQATKKFPSEPKYFFNVAMLYEAQESFPKAVEWYKKALALEPSCKQTQEALASASKHL